MAKKRRAGRAKKSPLASHKKHASTGAAHSPPPPEVIEAAQRTQRETGVPASTTLAQWAVESGYGKHSPGNNPFGIKAKGNEPSQLLWTHEKEKNGSGLVRVQQKFRSFDSLDDAFKARGELLSKHYPIAMAHKDDPDAFIDGLQANPKHSYATDPNYAKTVKDTLHRNHYEQYDVKGGTESSSGPAAVRVEKGEPTVMLGTDQHMAAHVESPHTGGGKIIQGSPTVFVGPKQLPFARESDPTNDNLFVKEDVQDNVFLDC